MLTEYQKFKIRQRVRRKIWGEMVGMVIANFKRYSSAVNDGLF